MKRKRFIEKIRKKGIECKPDGTGIPIFYTNDPKVMDMILSLIHILRGKVAYDTPEMKRIGREIKRKLQKDLRGTGFEVHSNLRFRF